MKVESKVYLYDCGICLYILIHPHMIYCTYYRWSPDIRRSGERKSYGYTMATKWRIRNAGHAAHFRKTVITFHTASFPRSQAWGPFASSPPNSTKMPSCDHSHQIPIDPDDGPLPPPLRSGSPKHWTKSFPVLAGTTSKCGGRVRTLPSLFLISGTMLSVRGEIGYEENAISARLADVPFVFGSEESTLGIL